MIPTVEEESSRWRTEATPAAAGRLAIDIQATIPHLTLSSLHQCVQRNGIGRLSKVDPDKPGRAKFGAYGTSASDLSTRRPAC